MKGTIQPTPIQPCQKIILLYRLLYEILSLPYTTTRTTQFHVFSMQRECDASLLLLEAEASRNRRFILMGKMTLQVIKCRPPWKLIMGNSTDQGPSFMQTRLLQRSHSSAVPRKSSVGLTGCDGKPESKSVSPGGRKMSLELIRSGKKHAPIIMKQTKYSPLETGFVARMVPLVGTARKAKLRSFIDIVPPAPITIPNLPKDETDVLADLSKEDISRVLESFARRPLVRELSEQNNVNRKMFHAAYKSFRNYCMHASPLDPCIAVIISDILNKSRDVDSIYPYFIEHTKRVYPHLECEKELKTLSDLTKPHNWYPKAREIFRKIHFHAGPTNSGKTYEALQRFYRAKTGFYCCPLRLLANEVCQKTNEQGVKCDMVTGEERRYATDAETPSSHVSMTVEMVPVDVKVEVAVIDEIQMLRDHSRGWAWTRALLGIAAEEVHLCGEEAAIDIVRGLLDPIGEHVEVHYYERKTPLILCNEALTKLDNVQDGDCLVCFSVSMLFSITKSLMKLGIQPTVIYGALPPWTKLNQAKIFNEMSRKPNVMVATDAVGMGLNLNIRRIIFVQFPFGEHQANYHVIQVAGRAGRFQSAYQKGWVTTLRSAEMPLLETFMKEPIKLIETAGIAPTSEQLETFSYHLPHASFLSIIDMFISISSLSKRFHLCDIDQFRKLAELIDDIPLSIKVKYVFCTAPVDMEIDNGVARTCFVRIARRFAEGQAINYNWFCEIIQWPLPKPTSVTMLLDMCKVYNLIDLYLWLSYKFPVSGCDKFSALSFGTVDMFPDRERVRLLGKLIESYISEALQTMSDITSQANEGEEGYINETDSQEGVESVSERLLRKGLVDEDELLLLREEIRREEIEKLKTQR
uniref:RNA helicase n=1 Tax=Setaria digitata TaxID=48799 RepID=A0A915Q7P2_9BILA